MKKSESLPRCPECGGEVRLATRAGRTREFRRGVMLPIPDDFEIPTCSRCGEELMTPEVSDELDAILLREHLRRQARELELCTRILCERHGVTQQQIEDACGVTRSYLSHLLAGRREASATLMRLVKSFVVSPEAFSLAMGGTAIESYVAGLFTVAPRRQVRRGRTGSRERYRAAAVLTGGDDPLRICA
jgi:transcriptional regulator with XRE-family HTH domain